jgi:hypothetical protein
MPLEARKSLSPCAKWHLSPKRQPSGVLKRLHSLVLKPPTVVAGSVVVQASRPAETPVTPMPFLPPPPPLVALYRHVVPALADTGINPSAAIPPGT